MSKTKHAFVEKRSGKDRRRIFNHGRFSFRNPGNKNLKERRLLAERRAGWVRVNKWSSVYLRDLKISKHLK